MNDGGALARARALAAELMDALEMLEDALDATDLSQPTPLYNTARLPDADTTFYISQNINREAQIVAAQMALDSGYSVLIIDLVDDDSWSFHVPGERIL